MNTQRKPKGKSAEALPATKLFEYWFVIQDDNKQLTAIKIYASNLDKAKEILRAEFKLPSKQIEYAGELIEHGNIYRKNLKPKFN